MGDFASQFIGGFLAGKEQRQRQQQLQDEQEDRKLRRERYQLEVKRLALEEKEAARQSRLGELRQGLIPPQVTAQAPGGAEIPQNVGIQTSRLQLPVSQPTGPQGELLQALMMNAPGIARPAAGLEREQEVTVPEGGFGQPAFQTTPTDFLRRQLGIQQAQARIKTQADPRLEVERLRQKGRASEVKFAQPGTIPTVGGQAVGPALPGGREPTPNPYADWRKQNPTAPVENWLTLQAKARKAGKVGAAGGSNAMVEAVLANPQLWDNITPTERTKIAPELAKRGFSGFGTKLSEAAINKMSETRSAMSSLKDLREVLQANEQYIGPVSGLSALNPYSEARKAQADIDRVRQRVGKALEGGVLRKEDEEKYKKILATLRDTPSTAIYKVDQLINTLEQDLNTFIEEQQKAGRRISVPAAGGSGGQAVGRVAVIRPDGQRSTIPADQLSEALKRGYRRATAP